jgi:hypothetical protein
LGWHPQHPVSIGHAIAYQLIETQKRPFVLTVIFSRFAIILMQAIGFFRRQALRNS